MSTLLATFVYCAWIIGLFVLDRERNARTSKALWIALAWLLINGSRPISQWLQIGPPVIHSPDQYLEGSPFDAAVFGFLIFAGVLALLGRWRRVMSILQANLPVVLFFCYCALSTLWSDYTFVAGKRWIKATGDVVMILLVMTDSKPPLALKRLLTRAAFVLLPVSVLLIKYYPEIGRGYNPWSWIPTYTGVTSGKNELGMVCLVYGLVCLWCFFTAWKDPDTSERKRGLIVYGSLVAAVLWLLLRSDSMTSTSCFVLAGSVMTVTTFVKLARNMIAVHLIVAVAVAASVAALFFDAGGAALESLGRDPSLTGRTGIWVIVLRLVQNPWVGTGFESFWLGDRLQSVWDAYAGTRIQEAHNGYLEVYLNLGWIGVVLLTAVIVTGYRQVTLAYRRGMEGSSLRLAFFVAAVIYSLTEAGFRMMSPIWFSFLLVTMAAPALVSQESQATLQHLRARRGAVSRLEALARTFSSRGMLDR
jgi:O-antigen ligase